MPISSCIRGKIRNPATGRCVYKDSPVLKKQINPFKKVPTIKVVPSSPMVPNNYTVPGRQVLVKCGVNMYINPKTKRCVQLKNKDIQKYLFKKGYQLLSSPLGPAPDNFKLTKPAPVPKVQINNPKNVKDKDIKVLVPPNLQQTVKLIYCGPGKVINPVTGRCVLLSSPLGKKLTSVPYVIINPPSKPQKTPFFIPVDPKIPKPQKGPYQQKPFPKTKPEPIKTALDTDGDNYVSVKEYLDAVESLGPQEKSQGLNFGFYNQRDMGILFLLTLIKNFKGPIHKIGCIPLFHLCVYKSPKGTFYTMENIKKMNRLYCPPNSDYYIGNSTNTYASITVLNAPKNNSDNSNNSNMSILIPPNLDQLLQQCEKDNKYMIVCDLTLLLSEDFMETSHSNVLVFDTRRKTVERFDPHGGNEYADVKLAYDSESIKQFERKDFMYGKNKYSKNKFGNDKLNKKKSNVLFDQFKIDRALSDRFKKELPNYTYYGTNDTTPYLGPQVKADEYAGLCVTWSCMYMVLRLLNPDLEPADITIKMIDGTPKELRNRILRFQKFIIRTLSKEKESIK
uniref:EF-hand domain-containing protein n=1 Tax=viral metagenome TaxID=1070528 RepID=A0A6C0LG71_9ZZZZ